MCSSGMREATMEKRTLVHGYSNLRELTKFLVAVRKKVLFLEQKRGK